MAIHSYEGSPGWRATDPKVRPVGKRCGCGRDVDRGRGTDREVTPVPGHPAVGQSLAAVRLSPAVAGRWPRKALEGRAAGLATVQLDEAAATGRHLPGGVGADGPVLDAAAHRRGSVRAPRVDYTPPGRDLLLHRGGVECAGA